MSRLWVWGLDGSGQTELTGVGEEGYIIGPVADDAMLCWHGTFSDAVFGEKPIKRYVGSSGADITSVPNHFVQGVPPYDFHTYAGAGYHGQTAILLAVHQEEEAKSALIYRSTDGGQTFTEVKTWPTEMVFKGSSLMVAYNGATQGSWWVNGAVDGMNVGLWHSTDDGLTWTFVNTPGFIFEAVAIYSAGRPQGRSV